MIRTLFKKRKKNKYYEKGNEMTKKKIITKILIHSRYIITDYIHILYIVLYLHFGKTPYSI